MEGFILGISATDLAAFKKLKDVLLEVGSERSTYINYITQFKCNSPHYFIKRYGSWSNTLKEFYAIYPTFESELAIEKTKHKTLVKKIRGSKDNFSDEYLLETVARIITEDNNTVNYYNAHKAKYDPGSFIILNHFGSWNVVLVKLGYDINKRFRFSEKGRTAEDGTIQENYSKADMYSMVAKVLKDSSITTMKYYDLNKEPEMLTGTYLVNHLGSWNDIILTLGLKYNANLGRFAGLPREDALELIKAELLRLNTTSSAIYVRRHNKTAPGFDFIHRTLKMTWEDLLKELKVLPDFDTYTDDELLKYILPNVLASNNDNVLYTKGKYLPRVAYLTKRFGSWSSVLVKLGQPLKSDIAYRWNKLTDDELYTLVKELINKNKIKTGTEYVELAKSNRDFPSYYTVNNRLGSLKKIISSK